MINRNHERAENVVKIKILTVDLDLNTFFKTFLKCTITNHMTKINKRKEKLPKTYLFYAFLSFFSFPFFLILPFCRRNLIFVFLHDTLLTVNDSNESFFRGLLNMRNETSSNDELSSKKQS